LALPIAAKTVQFLFCLGPTYLITIRQRITTNDALWCRQSCFSVLGADVAIAIIMLVFALLLLLMLGRAPCLRCPRLAV
jgi:hypothetical protein